MREDGDLRGRWKRNEFSISFHYKVSGLVSKEESAVHISPGSVSEEVMRVCFRIPQVTSRGLFIRFV